MSRNMTKNRKKKALRRRKERRQSLMICALFLLCIGAFTGMAVVNRPAADGEATEWYVVDGEMEILAAPVANTMERRVGDSGLPPFLQPTAVPEATVVPRLTALPEEMIAPEPTVAPEPTPEPAGGMHFIRPTEAPMAALEPEPTLGYATVKITAVGDCTLGGNVPTGADKSFAGYYEKYGADYFFSNVRELFEGDDLTIVNLEGPLTTSKDLRGGKKFNFRGSPDYVKILSGSSVEIANVANNHALDFGKAGLLETAEVLEGAEIGCSGFGREYYTDVNGVRVGSLGFTEWDYSQKQIVAAVRAAREKCDLLLVSMHWGRETEHAPTDMQKKLGRAIVDAGADLVIGTHTHVYGGVELYKGKYIVYSLGNFCFGGHRNPNDKNTMIFQQTFQVAPDGTVSDGGINVIPARVSTSDTTNNFQPYILGAEKGEKLLGKIAGVSKVDMSLAVWMEDSYQNQLATLSRN